MALSLIISEIFKYCNLEITVRGQSGSLKVVPFDTLDMVSYYCSIVTLSLRRTVFEIFDFKNAVTLKTGLGVRQGKKEINYVAMNIAAVKVKVCNL